ncbi:transposase, partial [Escherichia coli]
NHAEYQRRALPIKRETESCGDDPKQHDNQ